MEYKEKLISYLALGSEDFDIADLIQKLIDSDVFTKNELDRFLLFIHERIFESNYLREIKKDYNPDEENFGADFSLEEWELFEEKFCKGVIKPRILTEAEIEQLRREGRL